MDSEARHATLVIVDRKHARRDFEVNNFIRSIGAKRYRVSVSRVGDRWSATIVLIPPPDGTLHFLLPWQCDAASEQELTEKVEQRFAGLQKTDSHGQ